ncbi:MAG: excinuclease ABC subunit UvrC [Candidatus Firestonebacteria bacterium]|nr:excinuclease ABC subunit UvrC [Candidatus Firestonebacteria bacterium]
MSSELLAKVNPPDKPGVYIMREAQGKIIYVGKAVSLKKRLASYFRAQAQLEPKTQALVKRLADIEVMVTDTEIEALVLECTLIKKHRPRYNVVMRDDKSYPYLKVTVQEPYPRLLMTRKPFVDEARYFGPFVGGSLREAVRVISLHYGLRLCKLDLKPGGPQARPCLYAQIAQCDEICQGKGTPEKYRQRVQAVLEFLQGGADTLTPELETRMRRDAEAQQFELAAKWRDVLADIALIRQKPLLSSTSREDRDILSLAHAGGSATVEIFTVRSGNLEGRRHYFLQHVGADNRADLLAQAMTQYYSQAVALPPEILLPEEPSEGDLIRRWLGRQRGEPVVVRLPETDEEKRMLKMAETNAWLYLKHSQSGEAGEPSAEETAALESLRVSLGLGKTPERIEGYDISNISGTDAVGSQVVFLQGRADPSAYRRYRIRSVQGPNDFAMLQEVLFRRLKRVGEHGLPRPDLLVIDGGAGQLSAVQAVLKELALEVPVIGLAKQHEEIYQPGRIEPLRLPLESPALRLLTRLRDEAHRFAVAYHRRLRSRRMHVSALDKVEGLGLAKRRTLLRSFGSVEALLQVSEDDLAAVAGIGPVLARRIQKELRKNS